MCQRRVRRGGAARGAAAAGGRGRVAPIRWALALVLVASAALGGCRQDMHQAPRYDPLEESDFFADRRASRPLVAGTVARGQLRADHVYYTGKRGSEFVAELPVPVTRALLERGRERFDIYCSPCHSRLGDGNGMIVQRGLKRPPSFHEERLRNQPIGYFYDVMTNGFGAMPDYAAQVAPADRWAIAAYIRALQFSRRAPAGLLTDADRARLDRAAGAAPGSPGGTPSHE
jgi:mono/diheme cytochrome c family protein